MRKLILVGMLTIGACHAPFDRSIESGVMHDPGTSLSLVESLEKDLREMGGPYGSKSRLLQPEIADFDLPFESDDMLWAAALPVWSEHATGVPAFVDSDRAATHAIAKFLAKGLDGAP